MPLTCEHCGQRIKRDRRGRPEKQEAKEAALMMLQDGLSHKLVAQGTGLCTKTVGLIAKAHGIKGRKGRRPCRAK